MKTSPLFSISLLIGFLQISLSAQTAEMAISTKVEQTEERLTIYAKVTSDYEISKVSGVLNGKEYPFELVTWWPDDKFSPPPPFALPFWSTVVDLSETEDGIYTLIVEATDALGNKEAVSREIDHDLPPVINIILPEEITITDGEVRLLCDISNNRPGDDPIIEIRIGSANGEVLASGVDEIFANLDLSAFQGTTLGWRIFLFAQDSAGKSSLVSRFIYKTLPDTTPLDYAPRIKEIYNLDNHLLPGTSEASIIDFNESAALLHVPSTNRLVLQRLDFSLAELVADKVKGEIHNASLIPNGVVFTEITEDRPAGQYYGIEKIWEFHSSSKTLNQIRSPYEYSPQDDGDYSLQANGHFIAWTSRLVINGSHAYRIHRLNTSTREIKIIDAWNPWSWHLGNTGDISYVLRQNNTLYRWNGISANTLFQYTSSGNDVYPYTTDSGWTIFIHNIYQGGMELGKANSSDSQIIESTANKGDLFINQFGLPPKWLVAGNFVPYTLVSNGIRQLYLLDVRETASERITYFSTSSKALLVSPEGDLLFERDGKVFYHGQSSYQVNELSPQSLEGSVWVGGGWQNSDSTKILTINIEEGYVEPGPDIFDESTSFSENWFLSPWLGWFHSSSGSYIYHLEHGWWYLADPTVASLLVFDLELQAWGWTSEVFYPWIYLFGPFGEWVYYTTGGRPGSRWFYAPSRNEWLQEEDLISTVDFIPDSIAGYTVKMQITSGSFPLATEGSFTITFSANTYTIGPLTGNITSSTGTYTFTPLSNTTAQIQLSDSSLGAITTQMLSMLNETDGTYTASSSAGGSQSGTLTIISTPSP